MATEVEIGAESGSERDKARSEGGGGMGNQRLVLFLATTAAVWYFVEPVYVCGLPVAAGLWWLGGWRLATGSKNTKYLHSTRLCEELG